MTKTDVIKFFTFIGLVIIYFTFIIGPKTFKQSKIIEIKYKNKYNFRSIR